MLLRQHELNIVLVVGTGIAELNLNPNAIFLEIAPKPQFFNNLLLGVPPLLNQTLRVQRTPSATEIDQLRKTSSRCFSINPGSGRNLSGISICLPS